MIRLEVFLLIKAHVPPRQDETINHFSDFCQSFGSKTPIVSPIKKIITPVPAFFAVI
jgi:hypothetical protein